MQTKLAGLALLLSLGALAIGAYAVTRPPEEPTDTSMRLDELDARLARMEASIARAREPDEPTLIGLGVGPGPSAPGRGGADATTAGRSGSPEAGRAAGSVEAGETKEQIRELVDEAVTKKAAEIQQMQDKKPSITHFSKTLALTEVQREVIEREVVQAQHQIRALLETPTADGTNLLDELVEVMAEGMARPGEKSERGMKWFGRILTEQVPGTSETYAARAERAKDRLREALRRELTPEQHTLYESWQMDPSEIQGVPNSPWQDLEGRIVERAKDLGAAIPGDR